MTISFTDVATFAVLALASGRVAYSLTHDEIFRPMREWVWIRSAPDSGLIRVEDTEHQARFVDRYRSNERERYLGEGKWILEFTPDTPRDRGFWGQLVECPYCLSFYTSLLACAAWLVLGDAVLYPAAPLALWGASNSFAVKGL